MINRFNGSAWQSIGFARRYNGSNWVDSIENRFNGSTWQKIFPPELYLYNYGNQCSNITGGWSILEYSSSYTSGSAALETNSMHTWELGNGFGNKGFRTNNSIDMSSYTKIHIYITSYHKITSTYPERTEVHICNQLYNYGVHPSHWDPMYQGNPYYTAIHIPYHFTGTYTYEMHGDITNVNNGYIYLWDTSWSTPDYMNDTNFFKVWLT